jgi:hypothetical protein
MISAIYEKDLAAISKKITGRIDRRVGAFSRPRYKEQF